MNCHDCDKQLNANDNYMPYKGTQEVKCESCHTIEPLMKDYQTTEIYSRVVGYIRPVQQWNKGKQAEFGDRVEFSVSGCGCH